MSSQWGIALITVPDLLGGQKLIQMGAHPQQLTRSKLSTPYCLFSLILWESVALRFKWCFNTVW